MDSNLPDGTAVSLCAAMRLEAKLPLPPIIIISADPDAEITAYKDCLAQRFILKDKSIFDLLPAQISEAIEKWSLENITGPKEKTNHDKHR
jgi:CheY-like chemotaxis protein